MKKIICLALALLTFAVAGCSSDNTAGNTETVKKQSESIKETNTAIDVDLTKLSSTMVYSEVYNMMATPSNYIGKTVKMNGQFSIYQATDGDGQPINDQIYFACVIADATACCSQGLEFVLDGDFKYPEDYPELGTKITVVGEFQTYMEGSQQYCHLINAELTD